MLDPKYQVEHLFLLVGTNPLPNYVAAELLWRKSANSKIYFVHSDQTAAATAALQASLGFTPGSSYCCNLPVEEANPHAIYQKITQNAADLRGKVGLHYTGGTKAMAIHTYLALQEQRQLNVQYSYLDATTLRMVFNGFEISRIDEFKVGIDVAPKLEHVLALHGYATQSLKRAPIWLNVAAALATAHSNADDQEVWQSWVRRAFLCEPDWPDGQGDTLADRDAFWQHWARVTLLHHEPQPLSEKYDARKWRNSTALKSIPFNPPEAPPAVAAVAESMHEAAGQSLATLADLRKTIGIKDADDVGKWCEGGWLESYVFSEVHCLKEHDASMHIGDLAHDIQAKREIRLAEANSEDAPTLRQEIQLDVAFLRGYQLFVLACTVALDKGLCKSKLLEAAIRAEQIGGAEARVGLVCCFDRPGELEKEIANVLGKRVKVFGRGDLLDLQAKIADWISRVSP